MNAIIRKMAEALFYIGSVLGHLSAKFLRGWDCYFDRDRPGNWRE